MTFENSNVIRDKEKNRDLLYRIKIIFKIYYRRNRNDTEIALESVALETFRPREHLRHNLHVFC